jgi:hypothetical protein
LSARSKYILCPQPLLKLLTAPPLSRSGFQLLDSALRDGLNLATAIACNLLGFLKKALLLVFNNFQPLLAKDPGWGAVQSAHHSHEHAKSFVPYHIPVSTVFSCNYALFCATAHRLLSCFQWLAHSFDRDRGWGVSSALRPPEKTRGYASACPLHNFTIHSSQLRAGAFGEAAHRFGFRVVHIENRQELGDL